MTAIITEGFLLGLVLSILVGPSFFALIQTSIEKGFLPAVFLALGLLASDMFYVIIAYLGATHIFENPDYRKVIGIAGGAILILFGLYPFFRKEVELPVEVRLKRSSGMAYFMKGFLINVSNPFVVFFWLGVIGLATTEFRFSRQEMAVFFATTLVTVSSVDMLKAYVADKIKRFLNARVIVFANRAAGVILILFGILLLVRVLYLKQVPEFNRNLLPDKEIIN